MPPFRNQTYEEISLIVESFLFILKYDKIQLIVLIITEGKMKNYKYINLWLAERGILLADGFAEVLRGHADKFRKANGISFYEVYSLLGCSKQNISYWELHNDSTQSRRSVLNVIWRAAKLFELSPEQEEALANSAGLSLRFEGGSLIECLGYSGRKCELCEGAMISERMLRHYKKKFPRNKR